MSGYIDEYGRYRASPDQNVQITIPSYQYWLDIFTKSAVSAAQVSASTSATPVSGSDSGGPTGGGPDGGQSIANEQDSVHGKSFDQMTNDELKDYSDKRSKGNIFERNFEFAVPNSIAGLVMGSLEQDQLAAELASRGMSNPVDFEGNQVAGAANTSMNNAGGVPNPELAGRNDPSKEGTSDPTASPGGGVSANDLGASLAEGNTTGNFAEGGEVMFDSKQDVPGEVAGPGGPKDDAVPANLSDGEYVNTAEAVQSFGQPFFDQVNQIAKLPGATGLMTNPDFQKMQNEFLSNASSIAQNPATGNITPEAGVGAPAVGAAGLMAPQAGGTVPPVGMAEGGAVTPNTKGGGLMSPMEDFFDWLFERFSKHRQAQKALPSPSTGATINADPALEGGSSPKMIEDVPGKAKNMGTAQRVDEPVLKGEKLSPDTAVKNAGISLATRAIPGAGAFMAAMTPSSTNDGEDEALGTMMDKEKEHLKSSRTKDDTALPFSTKEDTKSKGDSLAKRPEKKQETKKTKETPAAENKLAPNASLGDAIEFYKRQDAPGFTFKGETYERSGRSPSGYTQV